MSLHQTFLSEAHHQWHLRFEFIDLLFYALGDLQDWPDIPFFEKSINTSQYPHRLLHKLFSSNGVECLPFTIQPILAVREPLISGDPQIAVGGEFSYHHLNLAVVSGFYIE